MQYALVHEDGTLNRIQSDVDLSAPVKQGWRWIPVVEEVAETYSEERVEDTWVIRNPAPRATIEKALIVERLTDEQLEQAMSLMTTRQKERWRMPGYPFVYKDDPEVLGLLKTIGADISVVLA